MTHHTNTHDDTARDAEIEASFWKALRSDRTVMLGLDGKGLARPMAAQIDGDADHGPIWFFTSAQSELARDLAPAAPAGFTFADKGHALFATVTGRLGLDNDPAVIDRLWNPFVAAWFEGGKTDPDLALLRFDPDEAEIWEDASSLLTGLKMLFGVNPQADYQDKVAKVSLA